MPVGRQSVFEQLRNRFPFFEYRNYETHLEKNGLFIQYDFNLADQYRFQPSLYFHTHHALEVTDLQMLNNFAFHIGMVELLSYWKSACPPKLIIRPHSLDAEQLSFWKNLYWNGLGEFFYLNGIQTSQDEFVQFEASYGRFWDKTDVQTSDFHVLVPIGGGKDSAVSLELLKKKGIEILPFVLNPNAAMWRIIQAGGFNYAQVICVERKLDPLLLQLNSEGFLNGHTPFSALLAFIASLAAAISGAKHIALSNESSASEATIPGTHINHQYSKSLHFENAFRNYLQQHLCPQLNYFSFLRPLNEVQIAWLFSRMPQYHSAFRSCNVGSKSDSWCGACPKCLFTYTMLAPFVHQNQLVRIFGKDLFNDTSLFGLLQSLAGLTAAKPFECVGTINEVQAALDYVNKRNSGLQYELFKLIEGTFVPTHTLDQLLRSFDKHHFLPPHFETLLQESLND